MLRLLKILVVSVLMSSAAFALTTVTGTLTQANGTAYSGSFRITWPTFMNAGGTTIQGGFLNVTLNGSGAFSIGLEANVGATPAGTSYRIDFDNLRNAARATEYWVVPASGPVTQASIRTIPPPTPSSMVFNLPSLITVGTITTGVWNGTRIAAAYGGTGINTSASTGVPKITAGTWSADATAQDLTGWPAGVSNTEVGYLDGVNSAIQTQLDSKASTSALSAYLPLAGGTLTGALIAVPVSGAYAADLQKSGSSGTLRVYDQTASTGVTQQVIRAGEAQVGTTTMLLNVQNNAGSTIAGIDHKGLLFTSDQIVNADGSNVGVSLNGAVSVGISLSSTKGFQFSSDTSWFGTADTGINRNAAGVVEVNNGTPGTLRDIIVRSSIGTATAAADASLANSQFMLILTSNTNLQIRARGSDGAMRSADITLAP